LDLARSQYPGIRASALLALGDLAVAEDPVVEVLHAACQTTELDDVRRFARVVLERLDRAEKIPLPWLEKFARHEDLEVRLIATRALCERAGQTNAYVQALGERVTKGDDPGSWKAIEKLAPFAPASEAVVPLITSGLGHPEPRIRGKAAIVLGQLGAIAKSARPALMEALKDEHRNVRDAAQEALTLIPE
jgi:HEAT repeat protein